LIVSLCYHKRASECLILTVSSDWGYIDMFFVHPTTYKSVDQLSTPPDAHHEMSRDYTSHTTVWLGWAELS